MVCQINDKHMKIKNIPHQELPDFPEEEPPSPQSPPSPPSPPSGTPILIRLSYHYNFSVGKEEEDCFGYMKEKEY